MDCSTRIRSALGAGAAKGLASLHEDCNPEILFRHVKAADILLNAKAFDPNSTSLCIYESVGALVSSSDAKKVLINERLSGAAVLDVSAKATIKEVLELSPSHQAVVPDSTLLCILESAGALVSSGDMKRVLTDEWLSGAADLGVPAKATIKEVLGLSPSHQAVVPESTHLCIHESAGALASSNDTKKVLIDEWLSGAADVSAKVTIKEAVGTDSVLLCIHESAGALASSSDTKRVVSFDLDESIASHQTKVEKRVDALTEIDEAVRLLNLGECVGEMNGELKDHQKDLKITVIAREGHLEQYSPIHNVQERRG